MEAFSDGVIAILITIMVLELKPPEGSDWSALHPLAPTIASYALSFVFLGIYWNNHHHLIQAIEHVDGRVLWANLHLLFWRSLIPVATSWMGQSHFAALPVAMYGVILLLSGFGFFVLSRSLIKLHGQDSVLATAVGNDIKARLSILFYMVAIPLAFVDPRIACGLYVLVAVMWLVPDRRIEKQMNR